MAGITLGKSGQEVQLQAAVFIRLCMHGVRCWMFSISKVRFLGFAFFSAYKMRVENYSEIPFT